MTKTFILNYLANHKDEYLKKYGVIKIGLFGSYAREDFKDDSDIDIAIELKNENKSLGTFFHLKESLKVHLILT